MLIETINTEMEPENNQILIRSEQQVIFGSTCKQTKHV